MQWFGQLGTEKRSWAAEFFYPNNSTSPKRAIPYRVEQGTHRGRTGDAQGTTCFENRFPAMWTGSLKLEQVFPVIKAEYLFSLQGSGLQDWVCTTYFEQKLEPFVTVSRCHITWWSQYHVPPGDIEFRSFSFFTSSFTPPETEPPEYQKIWLEQAHLVGIIYPPD